MKDNIDGFFNKIKGLNDNEVKLSREKNGSNELTKKKKESLNMLI